MHDKDRLNGEQSFGSKPKVRAAPSSKIKQISIAPPILSKTFNGSPPMRQLREFYPNSPCCSPFCVLRRPSKYTQSPAWRYKREIVATDLAIHWMSSPLRCMVPRQMLGGHVHSHTHFREIETIPWIVD